MMVCRPCRISLTGGLWLGGFCPGGFLRGAFDRLPLKCAQPGPHHAPPVPHHAPPVPHHAHLGARQRPAIGRGRNPPSRWWTWRHVQGGRWWHRTAQGCKGHWDICDLGFCCVLIWTVKCSPNLLKKESWDVNKALVFLHMTVYWKIPNLTRALIPQLYEQYLLS